MKQKTFDTNIHKKQSAKAKWDATIRTDQNAHNHRHEDNVVPVICPGDSWHMERHVQHVEKLTTSKRSAEVAEAKHCAASTNKKNNTMMKVILTR